MLVRKLNRKVKDIRTLISLLRFRIEWLTKLVKVVLKLRRIADEQV